MIAASTIWLNKPIGVARGAFLNGAVSARTTRSPRGMLALCKSIEERLGRQPTTRWADRPIDVDLLLMDDLIRRGRGLTLPHASMLERPFVMIPAVEVCRDMVHHRVPAARTMVNDHRHGMVPYGLLPQPLASRSLSQYNDAITPATGSLGMKIFIDTANIDEIREAHGWGILDGVTTNPSLIAREGGDFIETIHGICELVKRPVSAETVSQDAEE